jgi:hypothetical protein
MRKYVALTVLLVVALPASAEFTVVEETPTMTVYRDGDQFVIFTSARGNGPIRDVARTRSPERAVPMSFRSQLSGKDVFYFYLARTRMLDGEPICEKFVGELKNRDDRALWLEVLSLAPCGKAY